MNKDLLNNFIHYLKIDTQSDPTSKSIPSTNKQFNLLNLLNEQLIQLGLNVDYDKENGYIYAKLKKNTTKKYKVGFLAHVDTAPDFNGTNVNPQIINNYDGNNIKLNEKYSLKTNEFPSLKNYKNNTLITTDGNTLLGADDKAGIAIIMEMIKYFINNPQIKHGDIFIAFTRDEEIGSGVNKFDIKKFPVDFAYTVDGGELGEFQYENFNAASAKIIINGKNIHPGSAYKKMINSGEFAMKFHEKLPLNEKPELTKDYEGFIMLTNANLSVELSELNYIIRNHDKNKFQDKKDFMIKTFNETIKNYTIDSQIIINDSYYNMKDKFINKEYIIDIAVDAMKQANIIPKIVPIRGGTDGSNLSYMGIPTPNIFTGGHNFHGRYEFISLESMEKSIEMIINIVKNIKKDNE